MKMKFIMNYKKWDIVLIPFPFTDLSVTKKRPGLVISPDRYNKFSLDVIIVFMTSKLDGEKRFGDYRVQEWKKSSLPKPTIIRMKFATIMSSLIVKKIGQLHQKDIDRFSNELISFFTY